jgi:hypothetical protein
MVTFEPQYPPEGPKEVSHESELNEEDLAAYIVHMR